MLVVTGPLVRPWITHIAKMYSLGLLPDTQNYGLRMRQECRERFPHHRLQRKPLVSDPGMHHGTCSTHVPWCMSEPRWRGKRSRHCRDVYWITLWSVEELINFYISLMLPGRECVSGNCQTRLVNTVMMNHDWRLVMMMNDYDLSYIVIDDDLVWAWCVIDWLINDDSASHIYNGERSSVGRQSSCYL